MFLGSKGYSDEEVEALRYFSEAQVGSALPGLELLHGGDGAVQGSTSTKLDEPQNNRNVDTKPGHRWLSTPSAPAQQRSGQKPAVDVRATEESITAAREAFAQLRPAAGMGFETWPEGLLVTGVVPGLSAQRAGQSRCMSRMCVWCIAELVFGHDESEMTILSCPLRPRPRLCPGVEPNDLLTSVDGKTVRCRSDFALAWKSVRPADTVRLTLKRGGSHEELTVCTYKCPAIR